MCDPLTIAATAMSAAGAYGQAQTQANYVEGVDQANRDAYNISKMARQQERDRQDEYQDEADTAFADAKDATDRDSYDETQANAAADFVKTLSNRPDVLNQSQPVTDNASGDVKVDAARRVNKAAADSRARIEALSKLTGHGLTGQDRARTFGQTSDFLSTLGGLRRGSMEVANQEQNIPAATVTPGDSTFADLLSGGGMLLGMAGPGLFGGAAGSGAPLNATGLPTTTARAGSVWGGGGSASGLGSLY